MVIVDPENTYERFVDIKIKTKFQFFLVAGTTSVT